ncbi:phytase [Gloeobacter kilaueensis]|uniref:phytase n=1 Tax=Gloeobacter kilaueensis TaxID=1416614 RepID=UPI003B848CC1
MLSDKLRQPRAFSLLVAGCAIAGGAGLAFAQSSLVTVQPHIETPAVFDDDEGGNADSDDPAIWLHPTRSGKSLVIGTQKDAGLAVFDLAGRVLQSIAAPPPPGPDDKPGRFNNVDVAYGFALNGRSVDIAVTSDRGQDKLRIYSIAPRQAAQAGPPLIDVTDPAAGFVFSKDQAEVNEQATAYGLALYRDRSTGRTYAFVTQRSRTAIAKLELLDVGGGRIGYQKVGQIELPSSFVLPDGSSWSPCEDPGDLPQSEGLVVDQELGILYAAQEDVGIWRIPPSFNRTQAVLIDRVREYGVPYTYDSEAEECNYNFAADPGYSGKHLSADAEGLTLYYTAGNQGYLLASSQGDSTFVLYDRRGRNRFLKSFALTDNPAGIDGVQDCDGAAVLNVPLGQAFPLGLLVTQDGDNTPDVLDSDGEVRANTNFKFTPWQALARAFPRPLAIDPKSWNPRTGYSAAPAGSKLALGRLQPLRQ